MKHEYYPLSLRHLQIHLPWSIEYTDEYYASATVNGHRVLTHDVLHVMKSLGQLAADCEKKDHGREPALNREGIMDRCADLVICALHIANWAERDLTDAVVRKLEMRNNATIPLEHFTPVTVFRRTPFVCLCNSGDRDVHSEICLQVREWGRRIAAGL